MTRVQRNTKPSYNEFKSYLLIAENELERENKVQASLTHQISEQYVLLVSQRDKAKADLADIEAKVDSELREEFRQSKKAERVTDKAIESLRLIDPRVKESRNHLLELQKESALWGALKDSFKDRGYALRNLVDLYINNYYSEITKTSSDRKYQEAENVRHELNLRRRNERNNVE